MTEPWWAEEKEKVMSQRVEKKSSSVSWSWDKLVSRKEEVTVVRSCEG